MTREACATAGAATGAWLAKALIRSGLLSTYSLLLTAAAALAGSLALQPFAESREAGAAQAPVVSAALKEKENAGALRLVLK